MPTTYPVRPVSSDEFAAFLSVLQHAFNDAPLPADLQGRLIARFEFDRALAAFDRATMVGTAGAYSFQLRVPGAMAPVAGVTMVAVMPSHRRRGILTALMRRQLDDVRERGEAVAALFASEAGIYRRYGYGPASWQVHYTVRRGEGRLTVDTPADPGLRLRITEPEAARAQLTAVYERVLATRPGFFARNGAWWDRVLGQRPDDRPGACPLRCVLAEDDTGPRGYALFTVRPGWDGDSLPEAVVDVRETLATDPAATAAVWADLLDRDLTSEFHASLRPVDDPLLHLLADPRRLRRRVHDGLWIRLVDVRTALAQRRYACPVDVVMEVADPFCPWNEGRWRLSAGPSSPGSPQPGGAEPGPGTESPGPAGPAGAGSANPGPAGSVAGTGPAGPGFAATCERTTATPDVALPVHALGSAFLGDTRLGSMAEAGLITQARPGAVAALSAAMSWDPAPWCPVIF